MKFLICGMGGQFGTIFTESLENYIGLSHSQANKILGNTIFWDFKDVEFLRFSLKSQQIGCLIYCSSFHAPNMALNDQLSADMSYHVNVEAFKQIVMAIRRDVELSVVYFGSSQLYSLKTVDDPIHADRDLSPSTRYGIDKAKAIEWIEGMSGSEIKTYIPICCNHLSKYRKEPYLIPTIFANLKRGDKQVNVHNSRARVDLGSAEVLCLKLIEMINREATGRYVFGRGYSYSVQQIFDAICNAMNVTATLKPKNIERTENAIACRNHRNWVNTGTRSLVELLEEVHLHV